jgi:hypothetical protein
VANDLQRACARNELLERQSREHGRLLSDAAQRELLRIDRELKQIRPGSTLVDPSLASRYTQLVNDRAQILQHVPVE